MHATTQVTAATLADAKRIIDVVANAFSHDPVWCWAFPENHARRRFFAEFVYGALRYPWVYNSKNFSSVAVWTPPNCDEFSPEQEAQLPALLKELAGERAELVEQLLQSFDDAHPHKEPHYYLGLLATHNDYRGQGLGMALLKENLTRLEALHMPAYLESSNPANDHRYQSVGFKPICQFQAPDHGPIITGMWRDKH